MTVAQMTIVQRLRHSSFVAEGARFQAANEIERLRGAQRLLLAIPAVVAALDVQHPSSCDCSVCLVRQALSQPPETEVSE